MGQIRRNFVTDIDHDACGIGAVVNIDGQKTHAALEDALCIVERLGHRAGKDASGEVGDGVGILLQVSHRFFRKAADKELSFAVVVPHCDPRKQNCHYLICCSIYSILTSFCILNIY